MAGVFTGNKLWKFRFHCWKLTLFHNLHRFLHRGFPQWKTAALGVAVYIISGQKMRHFSPFCSYRNIADWFFITRKKVLDSDPKRGSCGRTGKIGLDRPGWGRSGTGICLPGKSIYCVRQAFVPQVAKKQGKITQIFWKKVLILLKSSAIIGQCMSKK